MKTSTTLLRHTVIAAALGSLAFAVSAQSGSSVAEEQGRQHSREGASSSATYPSAGGTSTEAATYGKSSANSRASSAGASGGGGSGMGTSAGGTAGIGNRTDAVDMKSGGFTGSKASPDSVRQRDMRGSGSDAAGASQQGAGKAGAERKDQGKNRKDREPHSSRGLDTLVASGGGGMPVGERGTTGMGQPTEGTARVSRDGMGSDAQGRAGMTGSTSGGTSWLPYTTQGYVGGSLGRADFDEVCGGGFGCDDPDLSGKIFTGGMINQWLGAEVGLIHFGRAEGAGGSRARAHGVNLSLVGALPVSQAVDLFAKVGTTYSWTRSSAGVGSPFSSSDNGFGLAWGVGASFDVAPNWAVTLDWERHRLEFANDDDDVDLATVGLKYKF